MADAKDNALRFIFVSSASPGGRGTIRGIAWSLTARAILLCRASTSPLPLFRHGTDLDGLRRGEAMTRLMA